MDCTWLARLQLSGGLFTYCYTRQSLVIYHRAETTGAALAGKTLPPNSLPPNMAANNLC